MLISSEVSKKSNIYWDLWWLQIAKVYSTGSKDPSTKVGAIVVKNKRLKSAGYNGFKSGEDDNPELYWDRDYKLKNCTHAEINALDELPLNVFEANMYIYPFLPCSDCASKILDDGRIKKVITTDYRPERWLESFKKSMELFESNGIQIFQYPITQVI